MTAVAIKHSACISHDPWASSCVECLDEYRANLQETLLNVESRLNQLRRQIPTPIVIEPLAFVDFMNKTPVPTK